MISCKYTSILLLSAMLVSTEANAQWTVDLSRRTPAAAGRGSASPGEPGANTGLLQRVLGGSSIEQGQEVVILNTERGFVPSAVRVRKDLKYIIYVVNVNEKEKNVSFILDGFSETHATFFGQVRRFEIEPKQEGLFTFSSPETGIEGRLVVMPALGPATSPDVPLIESRQPASATSVNGGSRP